MIESDKVREREREIERERGGGETSGEMDRQIKSTRN